MDLAKKIELELNDLETIEKSILLMPCILSNNIERVDIIKKALSGLTEEEKKVIQRTCIDKVSPHKLKQEFGCSFKKIYLDKEKALNKLTELMYGGVKNES